MAAISIVIFVDKIDESPCNLYQALYIQLAKVVSQYFPIVILVSYFLLLLEIDLLILKRLFFIGNKTIIIVVVKTTTTTKRKTIIMRVRQDSNQLYEKIGCDLVVNYLRGGRRYEHDSVRETVTDHQMTRLLLYR